MRCSTLLTVVLSATASLALVLPPPTDLSTNVTLRSSNVEGAKAVRLGYNLTKYYPNTDPALAGGGGLFKRAVSVGTTKEDKAYDEDDMREAMRCLSTEFCSKKKLFQNRMASCSVNGNVAYACNYATDLDAFMSTNVKGKNPCKFEEMEKAWEDLRSSTPDRHGLGWWHETEWKKTYGWDLEDEDICQNMLNRNWQFRMVCEGCECRYL